MQSHLSPSALLEKRAHPANGRLLTLGLLGAQGRGLSRGGRHGTKDARAVATSWQETNRFLARPSRRRGEANGKLHQTEPETSRQESQPPGFSPPATGQPHVDPKKKKNPTQEKNDSFPPKYQSIVNNDLCGRGFPVRTGKPARQIL